MVNIQLVGTEEHMCGRFTLKTHPAQWSQWLWPDLDVSPILSDWGPRYNIAPTQAIVGLLSEAGKPCRAAWVRWGLVPFWASDLGIGNRMINARAETLADKPAFRVPLAQRRCAIVADGYYEWQVRGKTKQPYWIHLPGEPVFALAGLWDSNHRASPQHVESATIITTAASAAVVEIHDRMPVNLTGQALASWLDPSTSATDALSLLHAPSHVAWQTRPVSTHVNNPRHEDAGCLS
jgi:putative SOS response-associated peptidase YedK